MRVEEDRIAPLFKTGEDFVHHDTFGNIWRCTGIVGRGQDAATYPIKHRIALIKRIIQPMLSTVLS